MLLRASLPPETYPEVPTVDSIDTPQHPRCVCRIHSALTHRYSAPSTRDKEPAFSSVHEEHSRTLRLNNYTLWRTPLGTKKTQSFSLLTATALEPRRAVHIHAFFIISFPLAFTSEYVRLQLPFPHCFSGIFIVELEGSLRLVVLEREVFEEVPERLGRTPVRNNFKSQCFVRIRVVSVLSAEAADLLQFLVRHLRKMDRGCIIRPFMDPRHRPAPLDVLK